MVFVNIKLVNILSVIPVILLITLQNNYEHNLYINIGFLISLVSFIVFSYLHKASSILKIISVIFISLVVYYLCGGYLFIYSILSLIYLIQQKNRKNIIIAIFLFIFSLIIPYIGYIFIFNFNIVKSYLHILPLYSKYNSISILVIFLSYMPIITLASTIFTNSINKYLTTYQSIIIETPIIILCIFISHFLLYNFETKSYEQIGYYSHIENWDKVLDIADKRIEKNIENRDIKAEDYFTDGLISAQINLALFHKGLLPDKMFYYSQKWGINGFLLNNIIHDPILMPASDIFFKLGHISASRRFAYESLAVKGPTLYNLERLIITNYFNNNNPAALKCINVLKKSIIHQKDAIVYEKKIENNTLKEKPEFSYIEKSEIDSIYFISTKNIEVELHNLLKKNPKNKMAFEYLMGVYLLQNNFGTFIRNFGRIYHLGFKTVPRYYQEALILFNVISKNIKVDLSTLNIDPELIQKFNDFNKTSLEYKDDIDLKKLKLEEKFSDTYWFYVMFDGSRNLAYQLKTKPSDKRAYLE